LGEQLAVKEHPQAIVIRTSWVYSFFGNNFVKTMMRLTKERESLNVVADQAGCPTYAADLASAIMQIIEKLPFVPAADTAAANIFHYSNTGATNWHLFASAISEIAGNTCVVNPIPSSAYPTPAKRPAYSVMDTQKIQDVFGIQIPDWRSSLVRCMDLFKQA
jgi:dTDP-4-dehydrorhamnose reductase